MEKEDANDAERLANAARYRAWVLANFDDISFDALISLFGAVEAHKLRDEHELAMAGEKTEEVLTRQRKRREYQRDLMRKRRAAEKDVITT